MHPSLKQVDHRPWPLPRRAWTWRQCWRDLAFIHHRVDAAKVQAMLPPGLTVQIFDGSAWVGIVPFRMERVMRRPLPDIPGISCFSEVNVRTYVEFGKKPGVWFFSLDAASRPVVLGGRWLYGLPYYYAKMNHQAHDGWHTFSSVRLNPRTRFEARYRPTGPPAVPKPASFPNWAAERYCLYSESGNSGLSRVEVHHAPWPIQEAEVRIMNNDLLEEAGLGKIDGAPVCHFSAGVEVVSFPSELLRR